MSLYLKKNWFSPQSRIKAMWIKWFLWLLWLMTLFICALQDLLHLSEYDLLDLGVHNHLHRLHLLTSLCLLQERERRRGTQIHSQSHIPVEQTSSRLIRPSDCLFCLEQTDRLSCRVKTCICPWGRSSCGVWGGCCLSEDYTVSHTHAQSSVAVSEQRSAEGGCSPAGFNHILKCELCLLRFPWIIHWHTTVVWVSRRPPHNSHMLIRRRER